MKNVLESFAVLLVAILSLAIIFFIVQYNLIEDDSIIEEITLTAPQEKKTTVEKTKSYLDSLEGYGDDVDVQVDATKESAVNKVIVKSEERNDAIGEVVEDKTKSSYMENLEQYAEESDNTVQEERVKKAVEVIPKKVTPEKVIREHGEPEKLPQDEIVDELGMAIDAALDDL